MTSTDGRNKPLYVKCNAVFKLHSTNKFITKALTYVLVDFAYIFLFLGLVDKER